VAFDAGAVLLTEGRKTDRLYVVIDGVIEILRHGIQVALVNEPGAVLGEISVLLDVPHTATREGIDFRARLRVGGRQELSSIAP